MRERIPRENRIGKGNKFLLMMDFIAAKCKEHESDITPPTIIRNVQIWPKVQKEIMKRRRSSLKDFRTEENSNTYKRKTDEYVRVRGDAQKQHENDIAIKAKDQPKLVHTHIRR